MPGAGDKDGWTHVLNGACSGVLGACVVQPLDVIRTRQQLGQSTHIKGLGQVNSASHLSTVAAARHIAQLEGWRALWNGLSASLYRVVPGAGMYFGLLHLTRERMKSYSHTDTLSGTQSFIAGSSARFAVSCVLHPITVIKTRMEALVVTQGSQGVSPLTAMVQLAKQEGRGALFAGFTATVIRDVPTAGLYLAFYEKTKDWLFATVPDIADIAPAPLFALAAVIAGGTSTVLTHPPDVIKTRLQMQKRRTPYFGPDGVIPEGEALMYKNSWDVVRQVLREEGVAGLYRGLLPRLIRKPIMFALTWTTYEVLVRLRNDAKS